MPEYRLAQRRTKDSNGNPKTKKWYITWCENGRDKWVSTRTEDSREAQLVFAGFLESIDKPALRTPDDLLLSIVFEDYVREQKEKAADGRRAEYAKKYFLSYFGNDATVANITRKSTEGYRLFRQKETDKRYKDKDDARTISVGTLRRELTCLRAALNLAVLNGKLTVAPKIEMPAMPPSKDRWLTKAEAQKLVDAAEQWHLKLFIFIALSTGARKGAILDLTWFRIDFANGRIDLNPEGRAQTTKNRPTIPMDDLLKDVLQFAKKEQHRINKENKVQCEHVIQWRGKPVLDIKRSFNEACEAAGLSDVTPHTLRHTCATWLAQDGVDMHVIAGYLGHSDDRTTRQYAHHHPDHLKAAATAIKNRRIGVGLVSGQASKSAKKQPKMTKTSVG